MAALAQRQTGMPVQIYTHTHNTVPTNSLPDVRQMSNQIVRARNALPYADSNVMQRSSGAIANSPSTPSSSSKGKGKQDSQVAVRSKGKGKSKTEAPSSSSASSSSGHWLAQHPRNWNTESWNAPGSNTGTRWEPRGGPYQRNRQWNTWEWNNS